MLTETITHSPGPWVAVPRNQSSIAPDDAYAVMHPSKGSDYEEPCDVCIVEGHNLVRNRANAHLIAAAPELLEALARIIDELPTRRDWLDPALEAQAEAAIKKAKGE